MNPQATPIFLALEDLVHHEHTRNLQLLYGGKIADLATRVRLPMPTSLVLERKIARQFFSEFQHPHNKEQGIEILGKLGVNENALPTSFAKDGNDGFIVRSSHILENGIWPLSGVFESVHAKSAADLANAIVEVALTYLNAPLRQLAPVRPTELSTCPGGFLIQPLRQVHCAGVLSLRYSERSEISPWEISWAQDSTDAVTSGEKTTQESGFGISNLEKAWPYFRYFREYLEGYRKVDVEVILEWGVDKKNRPIVFQWFERPWKDPARWTRERLTQRVPEALTPLTVSVLSALFPSAVVGLKKYCFLKNVPADRFASFDSAGWIFSQRNFISLGKFKKRFVLRLLLGRLLGPAHFTKMLNHAVDVMQTAWIRFLLRYLKNIERYESEFISLPKPLSKEKILNSFNQLRKLAQEMLEFDLPVFALRSVIESLFSKQLNNILRADILSKSPLQALSTENISTRTMAVSWELMDESVEAIASNNETQKIWKPYADESGRRQWLNQDLGGLYSTLALMDDEHHFYSSSTSPLFRLLLKEAAQHIGLSEASDVYFLSLDEVERAVSGKADFYPEELAKLRRSMWERNRTLDPAQRDEYKYIYPSQSESKVTTQALSFQPVEGKVVHVRHPKDIARFDNTERNIVISQIPYPALIAFFGKTAGIVTERGNDLCHLAISAKQIGFPVVVGQTGAFEKFPEGTRARLTTSGLERC